MAVYCKITSHIICIKRALNADTPRWLQSHVREKRVHMFPGTQRQQTGRERYQGEENVLSLKIVSLASRESLSKVLWVLEAGVCCAGWCHCKDYVMQSSGLKSFCNWSRAISCYYANVLFSLHSQKPKCGDEFYKKQLTHILIQAYT